MGKLTPEETVREHNRGRKAVDEGRSRSLTEPSACRSNPMNIMNCVDRRSSRATFISFNNTEQKLKSNYVTMTDENNNSNRQSRSHNERRILRILARADVI